VLLCDALELREINAPRAASWRNLTACGRWRICEKLAPAGGGPATVAAALREMEMLGIVRRAATWTTERPEHMNDAKYLANPDVSFRQEDDEGGILFHAGPTPSRSSIPPRPPSGNFSPRAHAGGNRRASCASSRARRLRRWRGIWTNSSPHF
jgi:hypothetical protein